MKFRSSTPPLAGITGVILAGGHSSRMGSNKALLPYKGGLFIEAIHRQLSALFPEVLLITNTPEQYDFLPCKKFGDIYRDMGALAGLHSGLHHSSTEHVFAVACDMPWLNDTLIRHLASRRHKGDLVIPEGEMGLEPLHAIYSKECLTHMEASLQSNRRRIISFFENVRPEIVPRAQVNSLDPGYLSFSNINTQDDYFALRGAEQNETEAITPHRKVSG